MNDNIRTIRNVGSCQTLTLMRHTWIAMLTFAASCRYPGLPQLSDEDLADGPSTDGVPADGASADGRLPPVSSCMSGTATCGAQANESCCRTAMVPGGAFNRDNNTTYPATVSAFVLDVYEVTVGRFRVFVEAGYGTQVNPPKEGAGAHPQLSDSGWNSIWNMNLQPAKANLLTEIKACHATSSTWSDTPGGNENKAINCVTWYEAMAFCIWNGGYLPTEAEWNYAASGGEEQRVYPWSIPSTSTSIDCTYANYANCSPTGVSRAGSSSPKGNGRWQHSDLAGSVYEWTFDAHSAYPTTCDDCANTAQGPRVYRGGAWGQPASNLYSTLRLPKSPTERSAAVGFRCAQSAP